MSPPPPPPPPVEVLDRAYNLFLGLLTLSAGHRRSLAERGLTPEAIRRNGYRSLPAITGQVARAWWERCEAAGIDPARVPGLVLNRRGQRRISGWPGILIPVRDLDRRIQGFQVRADDPEVAGAKYFWLSSASKGGPSPGAPAHLALPLNPKAGEVWITEGPLKADVAARFLGCPVIGVAGVGNWRPALGLIRAISPARVVLAYDADGAENPNVRAQELALGRVLKQDLGVEVKVYRWNPAYGKGIDDALLRWSRGVKDRAGAV